MGQILLDGHHGDGRLDAADDRRRDVGLRRFRLPDVGSADGALPRRPVGHRPDVLRSFVRLHAHPGHPVNCYLNHPSRTVQIKFVFIPF